MISFPDVSGLSVKLLELLGQLGKGPAQREVSEVVYFPLVPVCSSL